MSALVRFVRRFVPRSVSPVLCLGALLGLAACMPRYLPAGPPVTAPHLDFAAAQSVFVTADGMRLPLREWTATGPAKAVILAVHGFNDYSNAFSMPAPYWAERGVVTYAYDQRGFGAAPDAGRWAGMTTYIDDLRQAADLVRARHPGLPLYILGESMGGAIVMTAMTREAPPDNDGIILVAPAVWDRSHMPFYQTLPLWIASYTVPWMQLSAKGLDILPSDNIEMLRQMAADPLVIKSTRVDTIRGLVDLMDTAFASAPKLTGPSLILYGLRDEVVPEAPTVDMMASLPRDGRHTLAIYSKGYHMLLRDLEGRQLWDDILAWMARPDGALPSQADSAAAARLRAR